MTYDEFMGQAVAALLPTAVSRHLGDLDAAVEEAESIAAAAASRRGLVDEAAQPNPQAGVVPPKAKMPPGRPRVTRLSKPPRKPKK